jgi:DNA invertase Pin-like site-specific DNA recombinase
MLIGFASEAASLNREATDLDILHGLGCERIFSAAQGVFAVEHVMQYLRPGDVLAVADLFRLGDNLEQVVRMLEQIHLAHVRVRVATPAIVPGTTLGDAFAETGCILAEFSRVHAQRNSVTSRARAPGRPIALPPEAQARAERMLKGGQMSVTEIARVLGVSSATLYRYFPRGHQTTKIATKTRSIRRSQENTKPSSPKG